MLSYPSYSSKIYLIDTATYIMAKILHDVVDTSMYLLVY